MALLGLLHYGQGLTHNVPGIHEAIHAFGNANLILALQTGPWLLDTPGETALFNILLAWNLIIITGIYLEEMGSSNLQEKGWKSVLRQSFAFLPLHS